MEIERKKKNKLTKKNVNSLKNNGKCLPIIQIGERWLNFAIWELVEIVVVHTNVKKTGAKKYGVKELAEEETGEEAWLNGEGRRRFLVYHNHHLIPAFVLIIDYKNMVRNSAYVSLSYIAGPKPG